jgi:hypothetical protein
MGFLLAAQLALAPGAGAFVECLEVLFDKALAEAFDRGSANLESRGNLFIRESLIGLE